MACFKFSKSSTPKDKWSRNIGDSDEEIDSTWEGEEETENEDNDLSPVRVQSFWKTKAYRNLHAAKDMQNFRHSCRKALSDAKADTDDDDDSFTTQNFLPNLPNLHFYQNKALCKPDGLSIEELLSEWYRDYDKLEYVHSYIQWLFPTQEHGMNFESYVLTQKEIKLFHKQEEVKKRLLKSYKLMLDFYGIKLCDEKTGQVDRADNWRMRSENLNSNSHNNLRITRILKCLALLGFEHYQAPLVQFFLNETLVRGTLPQVKQSVLDYFLFSVINKDKLRDLIKFAMRHFEPADQFVWCPKRIQIKLRKATHSTTSETENSRSKKQGKASATSSEMKGSQVYLPTSVGQNQGQHQRFQPQDTNKEVLGSLQGKKKNLGKNHDPYQPPNDEEAPKTHDKYQVKKAQSEEHPRDNGEKLQHNDDDSKPEEQNKRSEVCEKDNILVNTSERLNVNICKEQPLVQKSSSGAKEDVLTNPGTNISQQNLEQEMENSSEQTEPTEIVVGPNNASNDQTITADIQQTCKKNHQLKSAENTDLKDLENQKDKSETSATTNLNTSDLDKRTHGASQDKHGAEEEASESGTRDKCRDQEKSNGRLSIHAALNEPPNDQSATTNSEQTPEKWFPEQR